MATVKKAAPKSKAKSKSKTKNKAPTAWNAGLTEGKKDKEGRSMAMHGVKVEGFPKPFTSVYQAFLKVYPKLQDPKTGEGRHIHMTFRAELKRQPGKVKSLKFERDGVKARKFTLIPRGEVEEA